MKTRALWSIAGLVLLSSAMPGQCEPTPVLPHQICQFVDAFPYQCMIGLNVTYWKNHVYLSGQGTNGNGGPSLFKFDAADPCNMTYISAGDGAGIKGYGVTVVEDRLYEANWGTVLRVYDLCGSNPPKQLGEFNRHPYFGWCLDVVNQRAYVQTSYESVSSTNFIFDVSNPSNPRLLSELPNNQGRLGGSLRVRGSYMYYVNENHFCIANVSDSSNPYLMTSVTTSYRLGGVRLRGKYALVYWSQDYWGGIYVFDISDPVAPVKVGQWPEDPSRGTGLTDMCLLGDLAICSTGGNGVLSFSIADPTRPAPVSQPNYGGWYEMSVAANGRYAYVGMYRHEPDDRGGLLSMKVYSEDPDDAGPGKWSNFSLAEAAWDTDYQADALPTADSPEWRLYEGTESLASVSDGILHIDDSSSAAKLKWIRNWDATNTDGATVTFRARCASYDTAGGSLDTLSNVYIEDGKYREDFAILSDRILARNTGLEYALDGTQWHTYRITTQGTQFAVYVDEAPEPVITGTFAATTRRSRVTFGSGSTLCRQDFYLDYLQCCSSGAFGPAARTADQTPDISINIADTAGKDSLSGIDPSTAQVYYSRDGGTTWNAGGCTVTCTPSGCGTPADRGVVRAFGVPFNQDSDTLNKIRFSLRDNAGNTGYSPVYNVRIDPSAAPTVTNVTSSAADGLYKQGAIINIQVSFSAPVFVTGTPRMQLAVKPGGKLINATGGSGTSTLVFTYSVGADEGTPELSYMTSVLSLNDGTIRDQYGSDADPRLPSPGSPGSLSHNKDIAIDSVRPRVTNISGVTADGNYSTGDNVDIAVAFSEVVYVTGAPQLELETGAIDRKAYYVSGSGTTSLTFRCTVQTGDSSLDLDYRLTNSLTGTIKDLAGNFANLTLHPPGSPGSLSYNSNLVIGGATDGSIAAVKLLPDTSPVSLGGKALYLKRDGFGYIEEPGRWSGIRIEGTIPVDTGKLVCLSGKMQTTTSGERYISLDVISPRSDGTVAPVGIPNRALSRMTGLRVRVWGRVVPGSVTANSYAITDGSGATGITVLTQGAPGVADGQFVAVDGAVGFENGLVIYGK